MEASSEKQVGFVTHYYGQIGVAVVALVDVLGVGDTIHIKGASTDFVEKVESMQVEHKDITKAERSDEIGLKVIHPVHDHDMVYKLEPPAQAGNLKVR